LWPKFDFSVGASLLRGTVLVLAPVPDDRSSEVKHMLAPNPHLRSIIDHDGAVILDIECNSMLTLNATGGYVWEKLQQGQSIQDIVRELAAETLTEIAVVERDVREFLEELKSKHLVTV
jgi:hypothetical protein